MRGETHSQRDKGGQTSDQRERYIFLLLPARCRNQETTHEPGMKYHHDIFFPLSSPAHMREAYSFSEREITCPAPLVSVYHCVHTGAGRETEMGMQ
jgi:hypothetical protein